MAEEEQELEEIDMWLQPNLSQVMKGDHERVIVHVDIDCFYAQVEMINNPELRHIPLGIQQKNIIVTCNYVAREHGVTKLSYIKEAVKKCPDMVLVNGEDLTKYREMSYKITEVLLKYSPLVKRLGFDENFIDITSVVSEQQTSEVARSILASVTPDTIAGHIYSPASSDPCTECHCGCRDRLVVGSQIAQKMRDSLFEELGITCCAGVAHNKLLAKLVAGTHKPNQQTTIMPWQATHLMLALDSARKIPGIGSRMYERLQGLDAGTVGQLQQASQTTLAAEFGSTVAASLKQWCYGEDPAPVTATGQPQSLSDEDSFRRCCDIEDVSSRLDGLLTSLLKRLQMDGRYPHTVRLSMRRITAENKWTNRESRQAPIPHHAFTSFYTGDSTSKAHTILLDIALSLFKKMVDITKHFHITLLNICFTKLEKRCGTISSFFQAKIASKSDKSGENQDDHQNGVTSGEGGFDSAKISSENNPYDGSNIEHSASTSRNGPLNSKPDTTQQSESQKPCFNSQVECSTNTETNKSRKRSHSIEAWLQSPHKRDRTDECMCEPEQKTPSPKHKLDERAVSQQFEDIDSSVFEELPKEIQEEIVQNMKSQHSMKAVSSSSCDTFSNAVSPSTSKQNTDSENTGPEETDVKTGEPSIRSSLDCFSVSKSPVNSRSNRTIPPNIDKDVFDQLPFDVQNELIQDWKRKEKQSTPKRKGIMQYFTKK